MDKEYGMCMMVSKHATPLDVDRTLNICQRRCGDLGISVRYDKKAETAYTDGRNIVLPYVGQPVSHDGLSMLYGMVIHECGHHLRPEAFKILKGANPPAHLAALYNITEDDGMERERAKAWVGDKKALSNMQDVIINMIIPKWTEHFKDGVPKDQDISPIAVTQIAQMSRLNWDSANSVIIEQWLKTMPKEVQDLTLVLEGEGWVRRFRATTNAKETWDLAVDLAKRLYPNNNQDEYEEIREAGHTGASSSQVKPRDDSKSSFSDAQSKNQKVPAPPESGEVGNNDKEIKGKAVKTKDGSAEGTTISWQDCVLSEHKEFKQPKESGSMGITWEGRTQKGGVALMPTDKVNVVHTKGQELDESGMRRSRVKDWNQFMPSVSANRAFANRIRRYIQARARSIVRRDRYHGKLDRGSIVKLAMPPIDGGEWNKKLFYDQRKHTMKDTAVFVLVDWSGSMRGTKMKYAADAAQRLVQTFDRVLNVPVALAAFSNRSTKCDIGYIKPWNTRGMSAEDIAKGFAFFTKHTAANNDGDSVNWAYRQLRKRPEKRKLLIVLSDGAPAGSWKGHADDTLKLVTSHIEKEGKVELYGVGIKSEAVKRYYTNYKVLKDASEINETLFNVIKEGDHVKR